MNEGGQPRCPECGGRILYDLTCHTYGGVDADGKERWWSCMPCDSAVRYLCAEWLDADDKPFGPQPSCHWEYTHGLNQRNPRAAENETRRPPWIPEGQACGEWRAPGVKLLGDD